VAETKRRGQRPAEDDTSSSKPAKLEIRTDLHGETIVQGSVSLEINSSEEAIGLWEEALVNRRNRLMEQDIDIADYESSSHIIATLQITSANISTGHGTVGKLQFVDLAGADIAKRGSKEISSVSNVVSSDTKLVHRSLETLEEVALARSQFVRSIPYRNSTLTHVLRDSLEADTKVLLFTCISTDVCDLQETMQALRFAHKMRQVNVGKATKHIISSP
jgi:kinesin family protein C2/C3